GSWTVGDVIVSAPEGMSGVVPILDTEPIPTEMLENFDSETMDITLTVSDGSVIYLEIDENGNTTLASTRDGVKLPPYGATLTFAVVAKPGNMEIVDKTEENACDTVLEEASDVLFEKLELSAAEVARIENGENIQVWIEATDISASVSQTDKNLIDSKKGNATIGMCLDIDLLKQIGSDSPVNITETNGAMTITLKVPSSLMNSNSSVTRTYQMIRVHSGVATVIPCTYNAANQTISFETDQFSTYALAYVDQQNNTGSSGNTGTATPFVPPTVNVSYRTHIERIGWEGTADNISTWKQNGAMSGTSGRSLRLEGINIVVAPATAGENLDLGIQYTTHCESYGWLPWSADGDMSGTQGESKRLESIKLQLTGEHAQYYDVYYRVHAESYGWLGWASNGAPAGTAGYSKRLEGIQIVVVKKGEDFNHNMEGITSKRSEPFVPKTGKSPIVNYPSTSNENPIVPGEDTPNVVYRTHVEKYGWQAWKYNGQMSGTSGESKRLEGIEIKLTNKDYEGGIAYTTHVEKYAWQGTDLNNPATWRQNGAMAGTSGESKRLEAICITLTGEMAEHYDVYYRVHAESYGWLGWASNGAPAGTAGHSKRLEGIQIVLVKKGETPSATYAGIVSKDSRAYIQR
ncbi:MAG: hypothetical protein IKJ73_08730, partial [Lachnospiraceae bacterium]|nr:hypothetical protein [Lachnospiraceae bacterium]